MFARYYQDRKHYDEVKISNIRDIYAHLPRARARQCYSINLNKMNKCPENVAL